MLFDPFGGEFAISHHQTAFRIDDRLGVESLLAVADWQRNINRGESQSRQFRYGAGPRATDNQVGASECEINTFQIRRNTIIAIIAMVRAKLAKHLFAGAHRHQ